ncbi:unnamed protein product [Paramecium pentaurelia]|uniref:Uncharacterized protein n=1 Tax=Paramecium pentaurelia TaxID=43138 RepID=A0A8S1X6H8_9CILI|nr:unnamed protein product [Paramecium pentaurelia]
MYQKSSLKKKNNDILQVQNNYIGLLSSKQKLNIRLYIQFLGTIHLEYFQYENLRFFNIFLFNHLLIPSYHQLPINQYVYDSPKIINKNMITKYNICNINHNNIFQIDLIINFQSKQKLRNLIKVYQKLKIQENQSQI